MAQLAELCHNSQIMPKQVPQDELDAILEVVETELISLHEGNIARYRLRPSEFEAWYKNWK